MTVIDATLASRTLTADEESVRCAVCGRGARPAWYNGPAAHVVTTIWENSASERVLTGIDHEPVCDNIAPDGRVYSFGRIVATETVGPYTIMTTRRVQVDGTAKTSYTGFIDRAAILPAEWARGEGEIRATGHSHASMDEALAFCIAYRHTGPNTAQAVAPHYLRGLGA